ncbi:DUF4312 family protein [Morganella psychrotolerans]|uniref:Cytoplasmic protein n=1 Tax=Morganella psychrotolerans TaxID=368603 RepID=A0A1B8H7B5_9GAMM|nr:DUF4312 family protein [Morganella psychrotolerans]OBU04953.1 cytoplasmic protein [Morganella psychrotolerans]
MKKSTETVVRVTGQGDTKQKAIADALNSIQKTVLKDNTDIILRIEPKDVAVISAHSQSRTEKFLFIFLPRKREHFRVVLDVSLDVTLLSVNEIPFTEQ